MCEKAVHVRSALHSDLDTLFEIAREFAASFVLSRVAFEASIRKLILKDDAILAVVEEEDEVFGYCPAFDHITFYANGRVSWVEQIAVRAD